jgi:hypothetical protein
MKTPDSIAEHQQKYHANAWRQYSAAELGQWVALLVKRAGHWTEAARRAKDLKDAQNYLNMLQAHIDAVTMTEPNHILEELPMEETDEPVLKHEPMAAPEPEPEEGIVYGQDGIILAISAQPGERGYDPDAHEKDIKILCDGVHIESAHTADVEAGTLKFYYRDARQRIKTGTKSGKIEIQSDLS